LHGHDGVRPAATVLARRSQSEIGIKRSMRAGLRLLAMARKASTDRHRAEAVGRLLSGLARGEELSGLAAALEHLHPRHDTFPGELFLRVAADALELANVGRAEPVGYEGLLDRHLPEHRFRGRERRKIQFAVLASAAERGGVEPDLLDEVIHWQTDDFCSTRWRQSWR